MKHPAETWPHHSTHTAPIKNLVLEVGGTQVGGGEV